MELASHFSQKKDGTYRVCIDFRRINSITVADRFPLPRITDLLQDLNGSVYFSNLDLDNAFYQIKINKDDREKTAFTTNKGHYQFKVLPFGLRNSPSIFSRLMSIVLSGMIGLSVLVYLDDVVIFSKTIEDHFKTLEDFLIRLEKAGLVLKLSKCVFLTEEIKYLGHKISREGISIHPDHFEAVKEYPIPTTKSKIRSFIGLLSYFRNFIEGFARKAEPLIKLLRKQEKFEWSETQDKAFTELKDCLLHPPVLSYPDFEKPFFIATDASNFAIGAVLAQEKSSDKLHPIHYISKTLSETERRYSTTKREALAVVYALRTFRYIVFGHDVTILTDHMPLSMLFRKTLPEGQLGRWAVLVSEYQVKIKYLAGKLNILADALSRIESQSCIHDTTPEDDELLVDHVGMVTDDVVGYWSISQLKEAQANDKKLSEIIDVLKGNKKINSKIDNLDRYLLNNGILHYRKSIPRIGECDNIVCIAIPKDLENRAIKLAHEELTSAHLGVERTITKLHFNYHFENIETKARNILKNCEICLKYNGKPPKTVPARKYPIPDTPFERVSMDILGPLPTTELGNKYMLVISDFLTRYVLLYSLPTKCSEGIVNSLRHAFAYYGTPMTLMSDNALEFCSTTLRRMCSSNDVNKCEITAYHPASNGLCERQNVKILRILRIFCGELNTQSWDVYIPEINAALNSTFNVSIGDTPFYALFHRDKRELFDAYRPKKETPLYNIEDYISLMEKQGEQIFRHIKAELEKQSEIYTKRQHDRSRHRELKVGQRVFCKYIPRVGESPKLAPKWEGPCIVQKRIKFSTYELKVVSNNKILVHHIDNIIWRDHSNYQMEGVSNGNADNSQNNKKRSTKSNTHHMTTRSK